MRNKREFGDDVLHDVDESMLEAALLALTRVETDARWRVMSKPPESMILGLNIRERNQNHVVSLAASILKEGQIQECVADQHDGKIRVWAGQHRFWAVELINKLALEAKLDQRLELRVRVYDGEFSLDQILAVQLAENLHNQMRPEEEAVAIESLWKLYLRVPSEERKSMADLARRIGRGEAKVRNALSFAGLDEKVRKLVECDTINYSLAVQVARLPLEKQFGVVNKIILYNLDNQRATSLIDETLGEEKPLPGLFSGQQLEKLTKQNGTLAFKNAADRTAKDADGYFRRVLALINLLDDPTKAKATEPILDILAGFIFSADGFFTELEIISPPLANQILWHVNGIIRKTRD